MSGKSSHNGNRVEEQDWRLFEYIVTLIENALNPSAVVEHDVWLYERKAKRRVQCDVVIRYGKPPRDTLTIIEVQKRNTKVDRHMLNAWCAKRDNVGAQQLICVSEKGFTSTAVETAKEEGNAAKLVRVMESNVSSLPFSFENGQLEVFIPRPKIQGYSFVTLGEFPPKLETASVTFTRNGQLVSLNDLTKYPVMPSDTEGEYLDWHTTDFTASDDVVMMTLMEHSVRVGSITTEVLVETERVVLTMNARDYVQLDYDGVLAWYFEGVGAFNGRKASLHLIFAKKDNGLFDGALVFADAFADIAEAVHRFSMKVRT